MATLEIVDRNAPALQRAKIVLTFCGAGWTSSAFTTVDGRRFFGAALASPYVSGLG